MLLSLTLQTARHGTQPDREHKVLPTGHRAAPWRDPRTQTQERPRRRKSRQKPQERVERERAGDLGMHARVFSPAEETQEDQEQRVWAMGEHSTFSSILLKTCN